MELKIINSNSNGNAYILENDREALLIECGVSFSQIKKAIDFNLNKVVGCILTHEHGDHAKSAGDVMAAGINVYATQGTHNGLQMASSHRAVVTFSGDEFKVGGFKIKAFEIEHDCAEPVGYLIDHADTGLILFLTDSFYSKWTFPGLNQVIIECNYAMDIIKQRISDGLNPKFLGDRVIKSHMNLDTCKETLAANDLSQVNNIVLIHLSDGNSDERRFKQEIEQQTGKMVHVARPGLIIPFNKQPF